LRQVIAANPNSDEALLLELAAEFPNEVMANPRFQLLLISGERWWEDLEPISMLRLLAALGDTAPRQARLGFFDQLGGLLASTDPLDMNMEWHMSFSQEITVEWQGSSRKDEDAESEDLDAEDHSERISSDQDKPKAQKFSIDFTCVVERNCYFLNPPNSVEDPVACLEGLIDAGSRDELLGVLENHGWEKELDFCPGGQGYWGIENVTPQLEDWLFESDLYGDGSGTISITDPAEKVHKVQIGAPSDTGDEYLNPTLDEHPDLIGSIFETDLLSSTELTKLLQQVITIEKQSQRGEANRVQA